MNLHLLRTALQNSVARAGSGLALALAAAGAIAAPSSTVTTPQVKAELVAHAPQGVTAGQPLWLGLKLQHAPHWHTYWKNPGDSGLPTTLQWTLPPGVQAADIQWPTPQKLPIGPLMNFGYEGTLLLPVAVTVPAGFQAETLDVALHAEWLVCKEVCIPESGDFVLKLPTRAATAGHAALFEAARAAMPQTLAGASAQASVQGQQLTVKVSGLPAAWTGQALTLLPETAAVLQNAATPTTAWQGSTWTASLPLDPNRSESPAVLPVVLTAPGQVAGVQLALQVAGPWPAVTAAAAPPPALGDAEVQPAAAPSTGLAAALGLALLGGLILNLMPCVFPVLSLKVLGFAHHAHNRRALLAGGLAYTVGVVLSFVALAGLLLALRAGGEQLGWGFQLQSPGVVVALAALFTLIGLNLAGLFEFGSLLPSSWATAQARHPLADSLLTGVLAVAVASPCTAPFMGASLGAAVAMPTGQALAVFATLGLGMALPYLAASAFPALAKALPRPGVWMQHFKTLMAFPMFATVVWLLWVLGQQTSLDAVAAWLTVLVVLALFAWAWGSPTLGPKGRRGFGALATLLLGATLSWAWPALHEAAAAPAGSSGQASAGEWAPWSADKLAELRAQGKPVFVDFTAAWCVTCQVNKRGTLANAEVKAAFQARGVTLLRADWTRRDPAITAELRRLGRSGVPVYALYAPGAAGPQVLSEILSVGEVKGALASLP